MDYDYLASAIKISIPTYSESKAQKGAVFFSIQMQVKDNKWYVEKRFSQFDHLFTGLKDIYHSLPQLPKKSFLFKMSDKDIDQRRQGLQQFLRKIIIRNDVMNADIVKQFLQLDKNASQMMVNPPKLYIDYTIEGQSKGIRDYFFVEERNIMLIATTDTSPVNRINAKVTNTKLPWEGEGGKFMEVGSIEAWQCDLTTSKFVKIWSKGYPQEAICLSYDKASEKILIGLDDGVVDFIKMTQTGYEDIVCDKIHTSRVAGLGYDSLTNIVFSVSQDRNFRISHGTSLALVLGIPHKEPLMSLYKDQINKRLFIGTKIGQILIYDVSHAQKPKLLSTLRNNKGGSIRSIYLDNNRNYLFATSYQNGEINVFELDKPGRQKLAKLNATLYGKQKIRAITWSAKRAEIMTGNADGSITFWNAVEGKSIFLLQAFDTEISRLEYHPERQILISASKAKQIKIWSLPKEWRDAKKVAIEQADAGRYINEVNKNKLAKAIERANDDSDEDDLTGWHLD